MISTRRLVEMTRKWQKIAARGRKRISFGGLQKSNSRGKATTVTEKGHSVAYVTDGKRYMIPLAYLQRSIFHELLNMAEEEFGLSIDGDITLPCDSQVIDYIMSLLNRDLSIQTENALLVSLSNSRCLSFSGLPQSYPSQHIPLGEFS